MGKVFTARIGHNGNRFVNRVSDRFTYSNSSVAVSAVAAGESFFFDVVELNILVCRFLSAGQNNGFNDTVLKAWMEMGNPRNLIALDLDSSDNIGDEALTKFLTRYGPQLHACVLSGMPHITDQLWMGIFPIMNNLRCVR